MAPFYSHNNNNNNMPLYPKRNRLGPRRILRVSRVVGHANVERPTNAICAQQVFARSLKAEEFPVERPVMWIAEHCANSVHWNEIDYCSNNITRTHYRNNTIPNERAFTVRKSPIKIK